MQRRRRLWLPGQAWKRTGKQYRTSSTRTLTGHWTPRYIKSIFGTISIWEGGICDIKTQPSKVLCDVLTDMLETLPIVTRPILTHKWQPLLYLTSWMKLQYNATMEKLWSRVGCPSIWYSTLHRPVVETICTFQCQESWFWCLAPQRKPRAKRTQTEGCGAFLFTSNLQIFTGRQRRDI